MKKYFYDLHNHSCLSPCADNDNTPYNLAGMAAVSGIDIMALTDHNSCKNCPAFFAAAEHYGIVPVAGIELTTTEEIHIVCLFPKLSDAMKFDDEIDSRRIKVLNRTDIFGDQIIMGCDDEPRGTEPYLLSNATSVALDEVPQLVKKYGGVCYPAHIDRDANGIIAVLGTLPKTPEFRCVELHDRQKMQEYITKYNLDDKKIIISSDAHYLQDIKDKENYFEFEENSHRAVIEQLFDFLRG